MRRASILALGAVALLSACGPEREAGFSAALPPAPAAPPPHPGPDGAIYQASVGYAPLYGGTRASRVGDLVTIQLDEQLQASKSTSGKNSRDGGVSLTPPSAGPLKVNPAALNSSGASSFNGTGAVAQASSLNGDITVTIVEVRPNGTALVRGEKVLQVSQGQEWIQLSGIVRLADIDSDNRLSSQRVADARINYGGKGQVQQAGHEGWLSRFFNLVTPF